MARGTKDGEIRDVAVAPIAIEMRDFKDSCDAKAAEYTPLRVVRQSCLAISTRRCQRGLPA